MPGIDRSAVINTALRRIAATGINIPTGGASPANSWPSPHTRQLCASCFRISIGALRQSTKSLHGFL